MLRAYRKANKVMALLGRFEPPSPKPRNCAAFLHFISRHGPDARVETALEATMFPAMHWTVSRIGGIIGSFNEPNRLPNRLT
ncbi:UNVERIFIED_ORG: hypothetical protein J2W16_000051 [Pseudomonas cremoricolorata]|nr:hypothetical protein [Pseudomonas cremoricolorata]